MWCCLELGIGFSDPCGSLPTWDILCMYFAFFFFCSFVSQSAQTGLQPTLMFKLPTDTGQISGITSSSTADLVLTILARCVCIKRWWDTFILQAMFLILLNYIRALDYSSITILGVFPYIRLGTDLLTASIFYAHQVPSFSDYCLLTKISAATHVDAVLWQAVFSRT